MSSAYLYSYEYRGCFLHRRNNQDDLDFSISVFRQSNNGRRQILTTYGFRDIMGSADPCYQSFKDTVLSFYSLSEASSSIDNILEDEAWSAVSDKTGEIYKDMLENARGSDINRDEIWAAACLVTGLKNTRGNK